LLIFIWRLNIIVSNMMDVINPLIMANVIIKKTDY